MSTVLERHSSSTPALRPEPDSALPVPRVCPFNRGFLDREDPVEGTGLIVRSCSFSLMYSLPPEKHPAVITALYERVYQRLSTDSIPLARPSLVDYWDMRAGVLETARRYVVVQADTLRSTHMNVFATFRSYGDYLHIAVDTFILPPLSIWRMFLIYLAALATTWWAWLFTGPIGFTFVTCPLLLWWNRSVVRSLRHGDRLAIALRRSYFKLGSAGTFDRDDTGAFVKSTSTLINEAITEVFKENGISVADLEQIHQTINVTKIDNQGGMNVGGSFLVGVGNVLRGKK